MRIIYQNVALKKTFRQGSGVQLQSEILGTACATQWESLAGGSWGRLCAVWMDGMLLAALKHL